VLVFGNIIVFGIQSSFLLDGRKKDSQRKNNHAFFRWVYGSVMMKLFLLAGCSLCLYNDE
jgi:hypothetical protein